MIYSFLNLMNPSCSSPEKPFIDYSHRAGRAAAAAPGSATAYTLLWCKSATRTHTHRSSAVLFLLTRYAYSCCCTTVALGRTGYCSSSSIISRRKSCFSSVIASVRN
jgi:hypothetical protein